MESGVRSTVGCQRRFSNLAVVAILTLLSFGLRQSEGFVRSLTELMRLDLVAPDQNDARWKYGAALRLSLASAAPV